MTTLQELKQEAEDLLNFGTAIKKSEGYGMMKVINALESEYFPKDFGIFWSIEDLEAAATGLEQYDTNLKFDRTKFEEVLKLAIKEHDASIGIDWEVLENYLLTYAKT